MQYLPVISLVWPECFASGRLAAPVASKGRQVQASSFLPLSSRTAVLKAMVLLLYLLLFNSLEMSAAARQPLQLYQGQQGCSTTHAGSSSTTRCRRTLQQQQPMPPAQTVTQVYLTFDAVHANATHQGPPSSTQTTAATGAANSTAEAATAPAPAAAPAPTPPPQPEAPWQQRRTLQLPPHVYLISFVMLLAIMAGLLSCHCWRMCRIARRMRQAAELGVTVSAAGSMLNKRTPQSVIESLPVSKYCIIHNQRMAKSTPNVGKGTAAAQQAGSTGSTVAERGAEGSSNAFVAAAMQIREQLARQSGLATFSFGRTTAAATAAAAAQRSGSLTARSSFSSDAREISPALGDGSSNTGGSGHGAAQLPAAAARVQDSSTRSTVLSAVQAAEDTANNNNNSSSSTSQGDPPASVPALTPPPVAVVAAAAPVSRAGSGKLVNAGLSSNGAEPCAICFEDFTDNDDVKQLPCNHFYHCSCIDEWLVRDVTCPLCKAPVLDQELLEEQQRIAAALEASFGNVNAALRRQQQAQRERRRARELRNHASSVGLGVAAAGDERNAGNVSAATGAEDLQQHEQRRRPRALSLGQQGSSTARELLELAGLAMLHMSGRRRGSSGGRSRQDGSAVNSQQQRQEQGQGSQQTAVGTDMEMGVPAASTAAERT